MTEKRFIVYNGDRPVRRFDDEVEAHKFAKMISKRDEITVTVEDVFMGTETIYREYSFWF